MTNKWDDRWLKMADEIASWSKHPTTKVGCVFVDSDNTQLSGGFNGLPRKINDDRILDQSNEVSVTVHAEANGVAAAARKGHSLLGSTVYVTHPVCAQCAALLIQAGVVRVIYRNRVLSYEWRKNCLAGFCLLQEAEVEVIEVC
jgi:dCMP deaminase